MHHGMTVENLLNEGGSRTGERQQQRPPCWKACHPGAGFYQLPVKVYQAIDILGDGCGITPNTHSIALIVVPECLVVGFQFVVEFSE